MVEKIADKVAAKMLARAPLPDLPRIAPPAQTSQARVEYTQTEVKSDGTSFWGVAIAAAVGVGVGYLLLKTGEQKPKRKKRSRDGRGGRHKRRKRR
ncbi:MAG: hypothetical protein ACRCSL_16845 [Microbacterium sp.]